MAGPATIQPLDGRKRDGVAEGASPRFVGGRLAVTSSDTLRNQTQRRVRQAAPLHSGLAIVRPGETLHWFSLEQGVELLLGVRNCRSTSRAFGSTGAPGRAEIVAIVGSLLFTLPFRLRFGALIILGRIVEVAVTAGVEVCVTPATSVPAAHAAAGRKVNRSAAFPAMKSHQFSVIQFSVKRSAISRQ